MSGDWSDEEEEKSDRASEAGKSIIICDRVTESHSLSPGASKTIWLMAPSQQHPISVQGPQTGLLRFLCFNHPRLDVDAAWLVVNIKQNEMQGPAADDFLSALCPAPA